MPPQHGPGRKSATIRVPSWKVTVPLAADLLPRDLVPMDGPAGEPSIDLVLDGASLTARAKINGKNYRKMIKQIDDHGAANVVVVLQGVLRPPAGQSAPYVLEGAGFQVNVKAPKPVDPAPSAVSSEQSSAPSTESH